MAQRPSLHRPRHGGSVLMDYITPNAHSTRQDECTANDEILLFFLQLMMLDVALYSTERCQCGAMMRSRPFEMCERKERISAQHRLYWSLGKEIYQARQDSQNLPEPTMA